MIKMLKKNWIIICIAFTFGLIVASPTVLTISRIGLSNFRGIYPLFNDDESHYLTMTKEIADSHSSLGNAFYQEHKNEPFMQPSLVPWLFAKTAGIFKIDIPLLFVVNDFLLTFLGIIILYQLFFRVSKSKGLSYLFTSFYYLIFLFSFGRPINPQLSFILLYAGMILIWNICYENTKQKIWQIMFLSLVVGTLVYVYPYCWTVLAVFWVLSLAYKVITTKQIFPEIKNFLIFIFPVFIIALPYLVNLRKAARSDFYKETITRMGMLSTHFPACYTNVALALMVGLAIILVRKRIKEKERLFFSGALILTALILNWQNVVTGKYLQFSSHYHQITVFLSLLGLIVVLSAVVSDVHEKGLKQAVKQNLLAIFIVLSFFSVLTYKQREYVRIGLFNPLGKERFQEEQKTRDLFDWFNRNTAPDSVVFPLGVSNGDLELFLIYTKNNFYSYGYAGYYLLPDSEMEDRWIRQNIFHKPFDKNFILADYKSLWQNKFIDRYQNLTIRNKLLSLVVGVHSTAPELVPLADIDSVFDKYEAVKKQDLRKVLKKFALDYIVLDSTDKEYGRLETEFKKYNFIKRLIKINQFIVYRFE